jgi:hypothetical protein
LHQLEYIEYSKYAQFQESCLESEDVMKEACDDFETAENLFKKLLESSSSLRFEKAMEAAQLNRMGLSSKKAVVKHLTRYPLFFK